MKKIKLSFLLTVLSVIPAWGRSTVAVYTLDLPGINAEVSGHARELLKKNLAASADYSLKKPGRLVNMSCRDDKCLKALANKVAVDYLMTCVVRDMGAVQILSLHKFRASGGINTIIVNRKYRDQDGALENALGQAFSKLETGPDGWGAVKTGTGSVAAATEGEVLLAAYPAVRFAAGTFAAPSGSLAVFTRSIRFKGLKKGHVIPSAGISYMEFICRLDDKSRLDEAVTVVHTVDKGKNIQYRYYGLQRQQASELARYAGSALHVTEQIHLKRESE